MSPGSFNLVHYIRRYMPITSANPASETRTINLGLTSKKFWSASSSGPREPNWASPGSFDAEKNARFFWRLIDSGCGEAQFEIGRFLKPTYRKTLFSGISPPGAGRSQVHMDNYTWLEIRFVEYPVPFRSAPKTSLPRQIKILSFPFFFGSAFLWRRVAAVWVNVSRPSRYHLKVQRLLFYLRH